MKRAICFSVVIFLCVLLFANYWARGQLPSSMDTYYIPAIVKAGGVFQTGQTLYIGVLKYDKVTGNQYWYDFSSRTFKTSGWTTQNDTMTEQTSNSLQGHYYYIWHRPASEATAQAVYYAFFSTQTGVRVCDGICLSFLQVKFITGP